MPSVAFTHAITRSTYTLLSPADGDKLELTDEEGDADAEGERLLDALFEVDEEGDADFEGELLGLGDELELELGERDVLCESEDDCE